MRIVFMGTPQFAVPSLKSLVNSPYSLIAVICQPDREKDRKGNLIMPPVKRVALDSGIAVLQFENIKNEINAIRELAPDIMVTAAYGQILSKEILDIPKFGIINVHASLLPKYRGSAPVQWAVADGEKETGVTIMQTAVGLDTGDIISSVKTPIFENETAGELLDRLSVIGADLLIATLGDIESGKAVRIAQDEMLATKCRIIKKTDGLIDWTRNAMDIKNLIHGMNPWPLAHSFLNGKRMCIHRAEVYKEIDEQDISSLSSGEIVAKNKKFLVKTGSNTCLRILKAQFEGKNVMDGEEILRGLRPGIGKGFANER